MPLHFERYGEGEPLVLIHGLGGSHMIWDPLSERLAPSRDVIAVDLPGFGRSPALPDAVAPSAANLGAAVSELLEDLGIERPHLAGNSLGGWAALEMAKSGEVASVCAISPAGLWRRPLGPRAGDARALARRFAPFVSPLLSSASVRARLLGGVLGRPERISGAEARALVLDWLHSPGYDAANAEMRAHVFEQPERVRVPTTIAWGERDRLVGPPRRERMPPQARYLVLPNCGHTPTWDDPELVAALLLEASTVSAKAAHSPG